ncbi:MAG TPA: hypothetical protein EYG02_14185 [Henriciella marina]|uniref:hypothetical protein n=1 Tax=Henriciella sp. TaxID=1968823 RepID=UPI0018216EC0|nr:hypothetical protein [Henriciella sp.]HIG23681.1 hypothetical protein [Henriciella sp.]HIK66157.1 hypothetical protein [Henriciella marina]
MLSRDWILETLAKLPVWTWPFFLIQVWATERYYRAYRAANPIGMLGVGVLPNGRIVITLQAAGGKRAEPSWRELAPAAPWKRLAPGAAFSIFMRPPRVHHICTLNAPRVHLARTLQPARPLAPP